MFHRLIHEEYRLENVNLLYTTKLLRRPTKEPKTNRVYINQNDRKLFNER